MKPKPILKKRL